MIGDAFVESGPDRERWLLSYADLLTLLLSFFVVMYSISAVNESKLEEVSSSIADALDTGAGNNGEVSTKDTIEVTAQAVAEQITRLGYDDIKVTDTNGDWMEITLASEMLFTSGQAGLRTDERAALNGLLRLVNTVQGNIQIEGHTDNIDISTAFFPSNWELSASRAAAVVRYLEQAGVPAYRLAAMGFGSTKPIATNLTSVGRAENRRVVVKVKQSQIDFEALLALQPNNKSSTLTGKASSNPEAAKRGAESGDENLDKPIAESEIQTQTENPTNLETNLLDPDEFSLEDIDPALLQEVLRELELDGGTD